MHCGTNEAVIWFLMNQGENPEAKLKPAIGSANGIEEKLTAYPSLWRNYVPVKIEVSGLQENTGYKLIISGSESILDTNLSFTTFREQPETITFLFGSCAFQPQGPAAVLHDGPMTIYHHMAKEKSDFMIWLGDNFYYLYGEWKSDRKMFKKQVKTRLSPELNAFMKSMPQYELWDDHDYGPNNSDCSWPRKQNALEMCKTFWGNPAFGTENTPGNYCNFRKGETEFFLLDDRYYCEGETTEKPSLLGEGQKKWLQEKLKASTANFKIICLGMQVFNEVSPSESWFKYPNERKEFTDFLTEEKIEGVLFLTGDRHWTELLKLHTKDCYPLYELTCSPLTSWPRRLRKDDPEEKNPAREAGTFFRSWNYGKISITGKGMQAELLMTIQDHEGKHVWERKIRRDELKFQP